MPIPTDENHPPGIKKSDLMTVLQELESFTHPKIQWEQYPTDSVAASDWIMHMVAETQDLKNSLVVDLGCGPGTLTIGLLLMGVSDIVAVDIDSEALDICSRNLKRLDLVQNVLLLQKDMRNWTESDSSAILSKKEELGLDSIAVVSNPPFGTKKKGADILFLEKALSFADVIYSLHLAQDSIRDFLQRKIPQLGGRITARYQLSLFLKPTYLGHKEKNRKIQTDLYRIERLS